MKTSKVITAIFILSILVAYLFLPGSAAYAIGKKSGVCGSWNNYCKKSSGSTGGGQIHTPGPTGPTAEERKEQWEKQDLREAAQDASDTGIEYYEKGDWLNAIKYFKEALEYTPDDPDIHNNLSLAEKKLSEVRRNKEAPRRKDMNAPLRKALEEAAAAAAHGKNAANSKSPQDIKSESGRVFDMQGNRVAVPKSSGAGVVDGRDDGRRIEIPTALAKHPEIKKLQQEKKTLEAHHQNLEKKLAAIRQKKANEKGEKGKLEVQEAKTKQELSNVENKIGFVEVKMESFVINLTKEKAPPKKP